MNRILCLCAVGVFLLAATCAGWTAEEDSLFPFVLPWDDATPSITDLSGWLDKPAGGEGFIIAKNGHLYAGSKRIRFFGVNLAFGANFPTHADAEKVAARMAKFGINCVRFHHMDTGISPAGLPEADRRTLDPVQLDKLDFFIARLKEHGIYADLNLHVGRAYPGLPVAKDEPSGKGIDNFFPAMIEQQKTYARDLLTHRNPYTGNAYSDEPAVALVEINNENGLVNEWWNARLDAMPPEYVADLRRRWNDYLGWYYRSRERLEASWGTGPGGLQQSEKIGNIDIIRRRETEHRVPIANSDWFRFLWNTEEGYWTEMRRYLREDLHVRSLLIGSQLGFSPFPIQAAMDVVDVHGYWQHPRFPHKAWDPEDWTVQDISMTTSPDLGNVPTLSFARVTGHPYVCTEYNHPAPNTFSSEAFLLMNAYAALQDWDGIFAFAYSHRTDDWDARRITGFFDIDQHPAKMASLPAAIALFCRGDIHAPETRASVNVPLNFAVDEARKRGVSLDAREFGIKPEEVFEHPVSLRTGEESGFSAKPARPAGPITSDNGELSWTPAGGRGFVTINAARSKGVIGFLDGKPIRLGDLTILPGQTLQGWATINLTVMDGPDFPHARKILVTATGYAANTGMGWKNAEKSSVGRDWGSAPSLVEGIPATIRLPADSRLRAWALDERGQRKEEISLSTEGKETTLLIGPGHQTLWYELSRP